MKVKAKICSKCKKPKDLSEFNMNCAAKDHRRCECKECRRKYRQVHFVEDAARGRRYYYCNREWVLEKARLYYRTHKRRRAEIMRKYHQKRRILGTDKQYSLGQKLHKHVNRALCGCKSETATDLLGCSGEEFKEYIESLFQAGMSWKNHNRAGWNIDCIRPCSSFDLKDNVQQRECFNFKNIQPLWAMDNLRKGNRHAV